jgi:restriction system protein
MSTMWMVRSGRGAAYAEDFVTSGHVAIGWPAMGPIEPTATKVEIERKMVAAYPEAKPATLPVWVGNVYRFLHEVSSGDTVVTFDPEKRLYFIGTVQQGLTWRDHPLSRVRPVIWESNTPRDVLSVTTRNSLGSIVSLFRIGSEAAAELRQKTVPLGSEPLIARSEPEGVESASEFSLLADTLAKADGFIEDRVAKLDWQDLQELVAGILRAMGYRTRVADPGPDRGVDVFASPDGLGLEEPRIFVEVKHMPTTPIGAPQLRSFLGGRKSGDRCLYVATGGFTKDARYEADRSVIPLTLIALPELRQLLVAYYEGLDAATTALVPLKRLYWPAD